MKYLFGPVNSRRLGRSLGIDLLPYKTCTLDCIYCECGDTTHRLSERGEYVPTDDVIAELDAYLLSSPELDYVTFSGSGEPTMHTGIGRIIAHLKHRFPRYRVAVLTNSTLLTEPAVRRDINAADVVVPSVDAISADAYQAICRPCTGIDPEALIAGLEAFRKEFDGRIIAEIFIVPGINDTEAELHKIRDACLRFQPDAIQLNSIDRPGCVDWIRKPSTEELLNIKAFLAPLLVQTVERGELQLVAFTLQDEPMVAVRSLLERRPSTLDDISVTLGMRKHDVIKFCHYLEEKKVITAVKQGSEVFYTLVR